MCRLIITGSRSILIIQVTLIQLRLKLTITMELPTASLPIQGARLSHTSDLMGRIIVILYKCFIEISIMALKEKICPQNTAEMQQRESDLTISNDGEEVTIATLHPACNIFLHKGYLQGMIWEDDFYEGLANGSVISLFDTTKSENGANIPNNDPKPYTEIQVCYDENNNLHVVYDATYQDVYIDTSLSLPWDNWWATYSATAGDTNAVFYDGSEHPKPQLRCWNSIKKTHILLAECEYPKPGEIYKWYNHGIYDSSAATWGKSLNDGPIANIDFLINKNRQPSEPWMVCVWEEMQGDISQLVDTDRALSYHYYAYMKDIKISVSNDGVNWSAPFNITNTPDRDESEVSVYRDVIDNKVHIMYYEDGFPGSDRNLNYIDVYEDNYIHGWPAVEGQFPVPIRKESTEPVLIIYRDFNLSELPTGINLKSPFPNGFKLVQNYPNPFNPNTTIKYSIPAGYVSLKIYNILGQKVKSLVDDYLPAGSYQVMWDGRNEAGFPVSTGIYLYKLKTENDIKIKKMLMQK